MITGGATRKRRVWLSTRAAQIRWARPQPDFIAAASPLRAISRARARRSRDIRPPDRTAAQFTSPNCGGSRASSGPRRNTHMRSAGDILTTARAKLTRQAVGFLSERGVRWQRNRGGFAEATGARVWQTRRGGALFQPKYHGRAGDGNTLAVHGHFQGRRHHARPSPRATQHCEVAARPCTRTHLRKGRPRRQPRLRGI